MWKWCTARGPRYPPAASSAPPKKTAESCACEMIIVKAKGNNAYAMQQSGLFTDVVIRSGDNVMNSAHNGS